MLLVLPRTSCAALRLRGESSYSSTTVAWKRCAARLQYVYTTQFSAITACTGPFAPCMPGSVSSGHDTYTQDFTTGRQ